MESYFREKIEKVFCEVKEGAAVVAQRLSKLLGSKNLRGRGFNFLAYFSSLYYLLVGP